MSPQDGQYKDGNSFRMQPMQDVDPRSTTLDASSAKELQKRTYVGCTLWCVKSVAIPHWATLPFLAGAYGQSNWILLRTWLNITSTNCCTILPFGSDFLVCLLSLLVQEPEGKRTDIFECGLQELFPVVIVPRRFACNLCYVWCL